MSTRKVVKVSQGQLRQFISEAISRKPFGISEEAFSAGQMDEDSGESHEGVKHAINAEMHEKCLFHGDLAVKNFLKGLLPVIEKACQEKGIDVPALEEMGWDPGAFERGELGEAVSTCGHEVGLLLSDLMSVIVKSVVR